MKRPSKSAIAQALGISAPAFSKYVKRGCPVFSVEAAAAWQAANVDPSQRLLRAAPPSAPAAAVPDTQARIALVQALMELAAADFDRHAERLRAAMRAVPHAARSSMLLDLDVWQRLLPPELDEVVPADPVAAREQSDAEADAAGAFLYALAAGELCLA